MSVTSSRPVAAVVRRLEMVPLRVRLVLILIVLMTTSLLITSLSTAFFVQRDLVGRVDTELRAVARPVAAQKLSDLRSGTTTTLGYAFVLQPTDGSAPTIVRPAGEEHTPEVPDLSPGDARVQDGTPFTVGSTDGELNWRFIAGVVGDNDATFAVGVPLSGVNRTITRLLITAGLFGAAILAISALLGWFAVKRAFRPLSKIEDTAAAIAAGDLTQRIPMRQAEDEVTSLSRSLNVMLTQIESSFALREASEDRMRQFVSDASHELRTPLATVRGYAELYRQGAVGDATSMSAAMDRIESEAGRMSGLVEDLLTLARLGEEPEAEVGEVDLTVLAADAVQDARARVPDRRISLLGLDGPVAPTPGWGSEPKLRQVLVNLLANAVRHTPEGSPIEVAVGGDGDDAVLEVRDHGPGIPPEVATKVFERFFRADPARGRSGGGGNGLGLAIVAAIVAAHHGRVGVADTAGGGATFVVRIPAHGTMRRLAPSAVPGRTADSQTAASSR